MKTKLEMRNLRKHNYREFRKLLQQILNNTPEDDKDIAGLQIGAVRSQLAVAVQRFHEFNAYRNALEEGE